MELNEEKKSEENILMQDYNKLQEILKNTKRYFEQREYYKALVELIQGYQLTKMKEILNIIFKNYVLPNKEYYLNNYNYNIDKLREYEFYYGDKLINKMEFETYIVWNDNSIVIFYSNGEFIFQDIKISKNLQLKEEKLLIVDEINISNILKYEEKTYVNHSLNEKVPFILYFRKEYFELFLQLYKLDQIYDKKRVVYITGEEYLEKFLLDKQMTFPKSVIINNKSITKKVLDNIYQKKQERINEFLKELSFLENYYNNNKETIIKNIKEGKPKILFTTSRFTTVLQYHTRDLRAAAQKLGLETEILMEKSDIHELTYDYEISHIYKFRPDIIICLDHFKFEATPLNNIPIVYITWVQDPMPIIMDKSTPSKLTKMDFILNHYITGKAFKEVGYDEKSLIDAPIPANPDIYKPYSITKEEYSAYSCDICLVCHGGNVIDCIEDEFFKLEDENKNRALKEVFYTYYNLALNDSSMILFSIEDFKEFISYYFKKVFHTEIGEQALDIYSDFMYERLNQNVYRQCLVDWIIDAGYKNIKLWGNGWLKEKKYKDYAMGPAQNGKVLSKIYQCSKIVIGNNIHTSSAARAWESMLSGAFYMSNYIPPEEDAVDIRMILEPEDFVMFYGKEDLLNKIDFYLHHEEERQKMIVKGREKALQKMTFDITMKNMLDALKKRL